MCVHGSIITNIVLLPIKQALLILELDGIVFRHPKIFIYYYYKYKFETLLIRREMFLI